MPIFARKTKGNSPRIHRFLALLGHKATFPIYNIFINRWKALRGYLSFSTGIAKPYVLVHSKQARMMLALGLAYNAFAEASISKKPGAVVPHKRSNSLGMPGFVRGLLGNGHLTAMAFPCNA